MRIDDLNRTPGTQGTEQSGQTAQPGRRKDSPGKDPLDQGAVTGADQANVSTLGAIARRGQIQNVSNNFGWRYSRGAMTFSPQAVASALIEAHLKDIDPDCERPAYRVAHIGRTDSLADASGQH